MASLKSVKVESNEPGVVGDENLFADEDRNAGKEKGQKRKPELEASVASQPHKKQKVGSGKKTAEVKKVILTC